MPFTFQTLAREVGEVTGEGPVSVRHLIVEELFHKLTVAIANEICGSKETPLSRETGDLSIGSVT